MSEYEMAALRVKLDRTERVLREVQAQVEQLTNILQQTMPGLLEALDKLRERDNA